MNVQVWRDKCGFQCFIRYVSNDEGSEDMLFRRALQLHTKGEDIFQCLDNLLSKLSTPRKSVLEFAPMMQQKYVTGESSAVLKLFPKPGPD